MGETLETYVAMAMSTKGGGVARVIKEALAAPGVFVFGELLDVPSVQELDTNPELAEHKPWHALLSIFAYGTYSDYKARRGSLPELGNAELHKLKELAVLTLASEHRNIAYSELMQVLDIPDVRKLEDLLIDAITHGLIHAKLDQRARAVEILDTMGRDVRPGEVDRMLAMFNQWLGDSQRVLESLKEVEEIAIKTFNDKATEQAAHNEKVQSVRAIAKKELTEQEVPGRSGMVPGPHFGESGYDYGYGDDMMMDDDGSRRGGSSVASRKKRNTVGAPARHGVR